MVLKPAVVLKTVHEKVLHWELDHTVETERGAWKLGSLEPVRLLILGHKIPTELLYMLVQMDSVCSSEQSRENNITVNIEIKLPTSLIKN